MIVEPLYVMDVDGSAVRRLNESTGINFSRLAWSPGSEWVVATGLIESTFKANIFRLAVEETQEVNLLEPYGGEGVSAAFSPTGDQIAFSWDGQVSLMDVDGSAGGNSVPS